MALDAEGEEDVARIFMELCTHAWSPEQLDTLTGQWATWKNVPPGWTALHIFANGSAHRCGWMAGCLLQLKANPMPRTTAGVMPLHTAAGTANFEVAQFLMGQPGVDVNAKNTFNETPYDNASGNEMRKLLALAGGRPGCNPTQLSAKECKRGQLAW